MQIELRWESINNNSVLVYDFYPGWTWIDFYTVKQRADSLLERSSIKIPLIFDFRRALDMPPGMIKQTRLITETRQLNGSPVIIVGASKMVNTTFSIIKRMLGGLASNLTDDVIFVQTWEQVPDYLPSHTSS